MDLSEEEKLLLYEELCKDDFELSKLENVVDRTEESQTLNSKNEQDDLLLHDLQEDDFVDDFEFESREEDHLEDYGEQDGYWRESLDDEELVKTLDTIPQDNGLFGDSTSHIRPMESGVSFDYSKRMPEEIAKPKDSLTSRIGVSKDDKAGLEKVDVDRVNQIIYENSKDSRFFQNEARKNQRIEQQVQQLQAKYQQLLLHQHQMKQNGMEATITTTAHHLWEIIDKDVQQMEQHRDLTRTFFHVDMVREEYSRNLL